jgi:hypothetical protein
MVLLRWLGCCRQHCTCLGQLSIIKFNAALSALFADEDTIGNLKKENGGKEERVLAPEACASEQANQSAHWRADMQPLFYSAHAWAMQRDGRTPPDGMQLPQG